MCGESPGCTLMASCHILTWQMGSNALWPLFTRTRIPPNGLHPYDLATAQRPHLPKPSRWDQVPACESWENSGFQAGLYLLFAHIHCSINLSSLKRRRQVQTLLSSPSITTPRPEAPLAEGSRGPEVLKLRQGSILDKYQSQMLSGLLRF